MKYIKKQSPPFSFERYTHKKGASFQDLSESYIEVKECLREALMVEQGYICCYCGQEISPDNSVIEHLKSRDLYPKHQLEYGNLVCSCNGGQDRKKRNSQYPLYCDANKGNLEIYISPVEYICESKFEFDDEGNIFGVDEASRDTIKVLNLNNKKLRNLRKSAIDAYRYYEDNDIDWINELNMIMQRGCGYKFLPFCFVIHSYIKTYRLNGIYESVC